MRRNIYIVTWIVMCAYSIIAAYGADAMQHSLMSILCGGMLAFSVFGERKDGA